MSTKSTVKLPKCEHGVVRRACPECTPNAVEQGIEQGIEQSVQEYKRLRDGDTELGEFHKFFLKYGVVFSCRPGSNVEPMRIGEMSTLIDAGAYHCISVSQAHLYFDRQGRYVGSFADEMGFVELRGAFPEMPQEDGD